MVSFEKLCMIEQITGQKYPSALTPEQENLLASMMQRREQGEPLQYIPLSMGILRLENLCRKRRSHSQT